MMEWTDWLLIVGAAGYVAMIIIFSIMGGWTGTSRPRTQGGQEKKEVGGPDLSLAIRASWSN